jgi:hypothetical protein
VVTASMQVTGATQRLTELRTDGLAHVVYDHDGEMRR